MQPCVNQKSPIAFSIFQVSTDKGCSVFIVATEQGFSLGGRRRVLICALGKMSGDIFGCHNSGWGGGLLSPSGYRLGVLPTTLQCRRQPHSKGSPAQTVSGVTVENPEIERQGWSEVVLKRHSGLKQI